MKRASTFVRTSVVAILALSFVACSDKKSDDSLAQDTSLTKDLALANRDSAAQQAPAPTPSYAAIINRLAGMPTNLDSLYSEAVRRRLALDSIIQLDGSALLGPKLSSIAVLQRMRSNPELVMHDPDSIVRAYASGLERGAGLIAVPIVEQSWCAGLAFW